jgi:hypothetical protein
MGEAKWPVDMQNSNSFIKLKSSGQMELSFGN